MQGIRVEKIKREIRREAGEKRRLSLLETFRHSDPTPHGQQSLPDANKGPEKSALDKLLYTYGMRHAHLIKKIPGLKAIAESHFWRLTTGVSSPATLKSDNHSTESAPDFLDANWDYLNLYNQLKHEGLKGRKIAVLTPCIVPGDAVSNDVVAMYHVLSGLGHDVRIFANTIGITEPKVHHVSGIRDFLRDTTSLFIYHFSVGWDEGVDLLRNLPCRKVVKYHNVTPPEFFEGVNEDYANVCRAGRLQLHDIAKTECDLFLFDSAYNMDEFVSNGADKSRCIVVPPFHHIDRLSSIDADLAILNSYRDSKTNIIVVGRLAPNKGHLSLIEAFAAYHYLYNRESRLFIVGKEDPRLSAYVDSLRKMIESFRLEDSVVFSGEVSDSGLKAYYLLSHVFMITSKHEGFCVPLVEALSMKIPVVAYGTSAIPGTAGNAALVWEEPDPYLLAASVNRIVTDSSLSAGLSEIGWRRYSEHFSNHKIRTLFLKSLKALL